jgi:hypothetical protein
MLKRKTYLTLAAAAFATLPVASRAATISFSYDAADMEVSSDGGNTFGPVAYVAGSNTVTVPAGDIIEFGVDVTVTGSANPAGTGTTGAATYNAKKGSQPAFLGLASYGFGMTDSKVAVANVVDSNPASGPTTSLEGSGITGWSLYGSGTVDDVGGGISFTAPESAANLAGNEVSTGSLAVNSALFGAGGSGPAELLNSLEIQATAAGTAVFTPGDQVANGTVALVQYVSGGSSTTTAGAPKYGNVTVVSGDGNTVNNLPALTVIVTGGVTSVSTHPIVSLVGEASGGEAAQALAYGHNTIPTLNVVGSNGSYVPASEAASGTGADVEVTGFNPATDNEVYALKLSGIAAGTAGTAEIASIIAEITAQSAVDGVSAQVPSSDVAALFPGYQIELVADPGNRSSAQDLGIDLSGLTENSTPGTVTLSAIAAVPEPASIGLLMGASGLLLGRRKRKA